MPKRQISSLFIASLVIWTTGNGLIPLLPVYAVQIGADAAAAGFFLAACYLAMVAGSLAGGWLSDRLGHHRLLLIITGGATVPVAFMAGQVHDLPGLVVTTSMLWFCGGLCLAVINILAGLHSDAAVRGRIFGLLALTGSLGAFLGGLGIGWLADHWGYPFMFIVLGVFLLLLPLSSLFVKEKVGIKEDRSTSLALPKDRLPAAFVFLVLATLISAVANFFALLIRSLVMEGLDFTSLAIASPSSIGGLVTIPLAYLVGWLSDRRGRKNILILGYLCGVLSLVVLALARQLWLFWTVSIFQSIQTAVGATVGNALATDLVPPNRLGRAMGLLGAVVWLGGVFGLAGAGIMIQQAGSLAAILAGLACMLLATMLLLFIHPSHSTLASLPPTSQAGG